MQKEELLHLQALLTKEKDDLMTALGSHAIKDPLIKDNFNYKIGTGEGDEVKIENADYAEEIELAQREKTAQDELEKRLQEINKELERIEAELKNTA